MTQVQNAGHFLLSSPAFHASVASAVLSMGWDAANALLPQSAAEADDWSLEFRLARYSASLATTMERSALREEEFQANRNGAAPQQQQQEAPGWGR